VCGRVRLSSDVSEIKLVFSIPPHRPTPNIAPSWNVAPTDPLSVVRYDAKAGERSLDVMRWGLVPFWAKDIKVGFSNINAKAEGLEGKPAFREAFQRRRCLVPVDNFYEWAKTATGKQPYAIALADPGADGSGRPLGDVALSGGREGAQLCAHHDDTKRDVRAAA
jgi:putative SOS response-associated peptidase YedK